MVNYSLSIGYEYYKFLFYKIDKIFKYLDEDLVIEKRFLTTKPYITNFETRGLKLHNLSLILGDKNTKRIGNIYSF